MKVIPMDTQDTAYKDVINQLRALPVQPVGIDVGAGYVKAVSKDHYDQPISFPSVYGDGVVRLRDALMGGGYSPGAVFEMDTGLRRAFGEYALSLRNDRIERVIGKERAESEDQRGFMAAAFAGLFREQVDAFGKVSGEPVRVHLHVVAGLPVNEMDRAKRLEKLLTGLYVFDKVTPYLNEDGYEATVRYEILVSRVTVVEQPRGAIANIILTRDGKSVPEEIKAMQSGDTVVIDGGHHTFDVITFSPRMLENGKIVPMVVHDRSGSADGGIGLMIEVLKNAPALRNYVRALTPRDWETILSMKGYPVPGFRTVLNLETQVDAAARHYAQVAISEVTRLLGKTEARRVSRFVLTGGSIRFVADALREAFGESRFYGPSDAPYFDNAHGFYNQAAFFVNNMK